MIIQSSKLEINEDEDGYEEGEEAERVAREVDVGEGAGGRGGGGWSAVLPRLAQRPAGGVVGLQLIQLHQEQSSISFFGSDI